MQTVGSLIHSHRKRLGLTLQQVADLAACTKGYLSAIENNRRASPPSESLLMRIEAGLRLEPGTLLTLGRWQETPDEVRRRVQELETHRDAARRLVRRLSREGIDRLHQSGELQRLVELLDHAPESGAGEEKGSPRHEGRLGSSRSLGGLLPMQVPVINKVSAGYPTEFTDLGYPARVADEYVSVPDPPGSAGPDPDAFAARVVGDSMEPQYVEGDIVVFSPLTPARDGSDCFVRFERDGESTFKRVFFESGGGRPARHPEEAGTGRDLIRLQPLNQRYPPRIVPREEVAGLYAAVYVVRAVGASR